MRIVTDTKIQSFWINFIEEFQDQLLIDGEELHLSHHSKIENQDIQYIENYLINSLKHLKSTLTDIDVESVDEDEFAFVQKMNDIMCYIVEHHPYMSSKFEDIIKIEQENFIKIKSEALIGNNILEDDIIKESLISNRFELIEMITKHELMKNIGVELTLKHIETAVFINQKKQKHKLSINISEEEIVNDEFFNKLKELKKTLKDKLNIDISEIIQFELLEYEIDFSQKKVWDKLKRLKSLDIDLSIDDFGSNFSNLKRLQDIRLKQEHIEYIRTIKIDKKITSAVSFEKFKHFLKGKHYSKHSQNYQHFLMHLTNIIDIPFINLKSVLDENIDKNIEDILFEIEKNYHIDVQKTVDEEMQKFNELVDYLKHNDLLNQINIVFEFIDNEFVKTVIEEIAKETNIDIMAQGYYFEESIPPVYHQDIKTFINKFINYLSTDNQS